MSKANMSKVEEGKRSMEQAVEGEVVFSSVNAHAEKMLLRKLDRNIVPVAMLLYLAAFLDRVNIGNARLYGLESDLNLTGNQYQLAVSLLFVTYLLFEVPSNLVLKKLKPRWFLSALCLGWGTVSTLMGLVQNLGGLIACRLILGVLEAGLFPCLTLYMTIFYKRTELALRIGYIFISAAIAGAFGGLLAYGIGHMDGIAGQEGWRWIFYLEGVLSVAIGCGAVFFLANDPSSANYLSDEEKSLAVQRLQLQMGHTTEGEKLHMKDVRAGAVDWRTWTFAFAQFGVNNMWYGYSTFLPTIIRNIGSWSSSEVQLLTVPCYALGAVSYLFVARLSDSQGRRALYCCGAIGVSAVGYILMVATSSAGPQYAGCFFVAAGLYIAVGIPLAWLPNNLPRYGKRAFSSGFQLTIGSFGGVASPFIYPAADGPHYTMGSAVSLGLIAFSGLLYAGLWAHYTSENKKRASGRDDHLIAGKTRFEIEEMGDKNPAFVYTT